MAPKKGKSSSASTSQPTYVLRGDGYYYIPGGDGTAYFLGSDNRYHPVIRVRRLDTGVSHEDMEDFRRFMEDNNNMIEGIEFTSANITSSLHFSSSADPYAGHGVAHMDVQLSNDAMTRNDYSTQLYHYRPGRPDISYLYAQPLTRTEVANLQNRNYVKKHKTKGDRKDNKDHKRDRRDPPGGGAGTSTGPSSNPKKGKGKTSDASYDERNKQPSQTHNSGKSQRSSGRTTDGYRDRHQDRGGHRSHEGTHSYDTRGYSMRPQDYYATGTERQSGSYSQGSSQGYYDKYGRLIQATKDMRLW